MIKNKIMNLLRKGNDTMKLRKMAMVFAVASMALVGGVACGVSDKDTAKTEKVELAENTENNKEESSVEETTEEVVEEATKEEVKETTKEEVKKEQTKEEVKKEQTSNTDKKKEENVKTEKPSKGNSNNTSSANKPSTGNGTTTNNVNKPSTGNGTTNKPSTGNSNNNNPNTNKPSNSGANIKPSTPVKPVHTHTHTWEEVTTTVYHEEQGHYENVVVKEAWTEKKPKYETQYRAICNTCGHDITGNEPSHIKNHMLNGENGSYRNEPVKVQVGTETINHPAVTERKWVIDKPAWTEKVVTGYKCSDCGATK